MKPQSTNPYPEIKKLVASSNDPTFLGKVSAVSGSAVTVKLAKSISSGLSIIDGRTYRVGQVGSFVKIPLGYQDMFAIISDVGATAVPEDFQGLDEDTGRLVKIQLGGESLGKTFERGISQYPNIGDSVHLVTESDLEKIYGETGKGHVVVGGLSSAENIKVRISLDPFLTRHSAILGSTGSGKSTTVASILRAIASSGEEGNKYPSTRILMLDIHGEYSKALKDIAQVFSVNPRAGEHELLIPYWALGVKELLDFLTGGVEGNQEIAFLDKIFELKSQAHALSKFKGLEEQSITVDTPIPFSIKKLWHDLIDVEVTTLEGPDRDQPALIDKGNAEKLIPPRYKPHSLGNRPPFINREAPGIKRQLNLLRSRMLDKRYNFLLRPGPWEPNLDGTVSQDLDTLLHGWLGGEKPITILDLSGVPSTVLERLVGSILKIIYESLYWSRDKSEGGRGRPLLVVMEEAHRYLGVEAGNLASDIVQKIAKEGRKYGIGAMVVSQRPSEVNETILSQCGTFIALRLSNPQDRARVQGTLPDNLASLMDLLPVLRTGEAIITGEAARLPMRCRITLPEAEYRPMSSDPEVTERWSTDRKPENYQRVIASWRAQDPLAHEVEVSKKNKVEDDKIVASKG